MNAGVELGAPVEPGAPPVSYPLEVAGGRTPSGALLGPDSAGRDRLLLRLCRGVVDQGGMVHCIEAWRHAAPQELRDLAAVHQTAAAVDGTGALDVDDLRDLIESRTAAVAAGDLEVSQLDTVLVVIYEADEISNLKTDKLHTAAEMLQRLARRGARVGVGFLLVSPTAAVTGHGAQVLAGLALDSGACVVLGSASPDVHRELRLRHQLSRHLARPGQAYLIHADGAAASFELDADMASPSAGHSSVAVARP